MSTIVWPMMATFAPLFSSLCSNSRPFTTGQFRMAKKSFVVPEILVFQFCPSARFMCGLKKAGIDLNRKMLSELAVNDKEAFAKLVETAKAALGL